MSFTNIVDAGLCEKLRELTVSELTALVKASSLGMPPQRIHECIAAVNAGEDPELPGMAGAPHPVTIQAWSFVRDRGQYQDTYGLSSARAGELADLLLSDTEKGVAEITAVVTAALRHKGSARPVVVNTTGLPTKRGGSPPSIGVGKAGRGALKEEILKNPAVFGLYRFAAEDTGRPGPLHFRVRLGGGLYAAHPSKVGAVDAARLCRVHGRSFPPIVDRIYFWPEGKTPVCGVDIPERVVFDGVLGPSEDPPADPVVKPRTEAPPQTSGSPPRSAPEKATQ
jgi:hypothetical protein